MLRRCPQAELPLLPCRLANTLGDVRIRNDRLGYSDRFFMFADLATAQGILHLKLVVGYALFNEQKIIRVRRLSNGTGN